LAFIALLSGATVRAEPSASLQNPILAYYPPAALEQGIDGGVILSCGRTEHAGFTGCRVVKEAPAGLGFADAALAIAAHAVECPALTLPAEKRAPKFVLFQFSASPAGITPDLLNPNGPVLQGDWLRRPTGDDMANNYPRRAEYDLRNGHATMVCQSDETGRLHDCTITNETPLGYGFGEADLKLLPHFKITPSVDCSGRPVSSTIVIPIGWIVPGGY
jgi:hypothetical protein